MAADCVLIAEDDELIREVTSRILQNAGYRVLLAADGQEATALYDTHAADIHMVLLDVVMPRLGGPGVYKHIRKSCHQLPILFTTGYSPTELDPLLQSDSRSALIHKPYRAAELVERLQKLATDSVPG